MISRGDCTLICQRTSGDRELHVRKIGDSYFACHFPGGAHGDHKISRITDEHLHGTDCWIQAWSDAGFSTAREVATNNSTRLDAVAFGNRVVALETQFSPQAPARVKARHTQRRRAKAFTGEHARQLTEPLEVLWFSPAGIRDWLYSVPSVYSNDQSWTGAVPSPRSVQAIGVRSVDIRRCEPTWFHSCPESRYGWCGRFHPAVSLRGKLTIADVADQVAAGELASIRVGNSLFLADSASRKRYEFYSDERIGDPWAERPARGNSSPDCAADAHQRTPERLCQLGCGKIPGPGGVLCPECKDQLTARAVHG